jgi:prepilin-type N-terminal cleavage/methylation domain-containing protein
VGGAKLAGKLLLFRGEKGARIMKTRRRHSGFTLVEIMVVVAIIALLTAIATSGFLRARKKSQAARVLDDLRLLDAAVDQYAMETGHVGGTNPNFDDLKVYLKANQWLYNSGKDIFGNDYGPFTIDQYPVVPTRTFDALSDVADSYYWSPYY